jgi:hypothetical protein
VVSNFASSIFYLLFGISNLQVATLFTVDVANFTTLLLDDDQISPSLKTNCERLSIN